MKGAITIFITYLTIQWRITSDTKEIIKASR